MGEYCNGFGGFASSPLAKIPRGFGARFVWQLRHQESTPGITIPPATQARYRCVGRLYLGGVQKRRSKDMVGRGKKRIGRNVLFPLSTRHSFLCSLPNVSFVSGISLVNDNKKQAYSK